MSSFCITFPSAFFHGVLQCYHGMTCRISNNQTGTYVSCRKWKVRPKTNSVAQNWWVMEAVRTIPLSLPKKMQAYNLSHSSINLAVIQFQFISENNMHKFVKLKIVFDLFLNRAITYRLFRYLGMWVEYVSDILIEKSLYHPHSWKQDLMKHSLVMWYRADLLKSLAMFLVTFSPRS